jgi:hypothetical protein
MNDDRKDKDQAKPTAGSKLPEEPGERPDLPPRQKLKLVTTEEERLAAEIEKLRK